jgi:Tol biopolymer transport system component
MKRRAIACVVGISAAAAASVAVGRAQAPPGRNAAAPTGLLAFTSYDRGFRIVTMRPNGTGVRVLVPHGMEPVWSPDGRWLAFTREAPGTGYPSIWRVRADGTGRRRVSRFGTGLDAPRPSLPSWSPDSRRIVFNAQYTVDGPPNDAGEPPTDTGVFVARRDGSKPRRLRANTGFTGPAWSSDGRRIALVTEGGAIGVMSPRGGPLRVLRRGLDVRGRLQFSPDGKRLLTIVGFMPPTITILDVRTGKRTRIPAAEGELLGSATWTPDGRLGYVASAGWTPDGGLPPGSPTRLFTIRRDGKGKRVLATLTTDISGDISWRRSARQR